MSIAGRLSHIVSISSVIASVFAFAGSAQAGQIEDMAMAFGTRDQVQDASLSPDGTHIAVLQPMNSHGVALLITDLTQGAGAKPTLILSTDGKPENLRSCNWASNSRLLCTIAGVGSLGTGELTNFSRVLALDSTGGNVKIINTTGTSAKTLGIVLGGGYVVDWNTGTDGHVLMMQAYIPEQDIGTRLAQKKQGVGLDDIDTATLRHKSVESPEDRVSEYITDGHGNVRVKGVEQLSTSAGYASGITQYYYLKPGTKNWSPLSTYESVKRDGFLPQAVDPDKNVVYGVKEVNGRLAAFSISLDGNLTQTQIYANDQVDVDGFVTVGRSQRVIGISYATDSRHMVYLDPALEKLANALSKALPNLPQVSFVDASQDEQKLLLWAGSDSDPGHYYLFDRTSRKLDEILLQRPALEKMQLAEQKAVTYRAADGTAVPAYLTLPPGKADAKGLPAIVMPHGGPSARDEWGFDWLPQYWASIGYAVLQPNYRGSDGFGENWFQTNGFQNWRVAIGDIDDGGRWLVQQGIADPDKLAIFGWSYGGYAALQSAVTEPGLFKAVVAVAPVTDLGKAKDEWANWNNAILVRDFIGSGQHVDAGSPARHADQISVPVQMFHGTQDRNVSVDQSKLMDSRLKAAGKSSELVIYDGLDHQLPDDGARADMLTKSAHFLAEHLKK